MEHNYRQLGASITYQAIRDYIAAEHEPKKQTVIIKQLRSPWMDLISNGLAPILADKLETNPKEICDRVKRYDREENLSRNKSIFYADLLMEQQEQM